MKYLNVYYFRYQWSQAIFTFLPSVASQCVQQVRNTKDFIEDSDITIVSYDLVHRMMDQLEKKPFGVIIVVSKSHSNSVGFLLLLLHYHKLVISGRVAFSQKLQNRQDESCYKNCRSC